MSVMRTQHQQLNDGTVFENAPALGHFRDICRKMWILETPVGSEASRTSLLCVSDDSSMLLNHHSALAETVLYFRNSLGSRPSRFSTLSRISGERLDFERQNFVWRSPMMSCMRTQHQRLNDEPSSENAPALGRFRDIFPKTRISRRRSAARLLERDCDYPDGSMMLVKHHWAFKIDLIVRNRSVCRPTPILTFWRISGERLDFERRNFVCRSTLMS